MNTKALAALKAEIAVWRRWASGDSVPVGSVFDPSKLPLCYAFNSTRAHPSCAGCPVHNHTGRNCDGTPLGGVNRACHKHGTRSERFRRAAARMAGFLESLLPKEKP